MLEICLTLFYYLLFKNRFVTVITHHGEPKHKDGQDDEEPASIHHQVTGDNSPRIEEIVKREKVQEQHTAEEDGHGQQLIPEVRHCPIIAWKKEGHCVNEKGSRANN